MGWSYRLWRRRFQERLGKDADDSELALRVARSYAARLSYFDRDVGAGLIIHGRRMVEDGRYEAALAALDEAVEIGTKHVHRSPIRYAPIIATGLLRKSWVLDAVGRRDEALDAAERAARIFRALVKMRPGHFELPLYSALSCVTTWTQPSEESLATAEEALAVCRRAVRQPGWREVHRAAALHNVATCLRAAGRPGDALPTAEEAVRVYRVLDHADGAEYWPRFEGSLRSLEAILTDLDRYSDAAAVAQEAAEIRARRSSP